MTAQLEDQISEWINADPDPATRAELARLTEADPAEIERRFSQRLRFGTAGLRGPLGAGPNHMNRVVVRMAAWALATRLRADHDGGLVVIGYDARHLSEEFAHDTARVVAALGLTAEVSDGVVPTPVLAFAVRDRTAIAGVMVTASHNPPGDNGYKVYWNDGAQIIPPIDADIEALIESRPPLQEDELAAFSEVTVLPAEELIGRYLDVIVGESQLELEPPKTVYTPLHGIGGSTTLAAFQRRRLPKPTVVERQFAPDGRFPTVALPNPEEDGALDLAFETADQTGADLIVAHDPDADRLGVAVRANGAWRTLTGDEIGTLLGDELLRRGSGAARLVACSVVSSSSLGWIAEHHGVQFRRTLTGFKWIIRPSMDEPDLEYVFGYEEALGFATDARVRDKDGISAAIVLCELAARLRSDDASLLDRLDAIAVRDGLALTGQRSVRFDDDRDALGRIMSRLRNSPPHRLADINIVRHHDWLGADTPTDIVELDLAEVGRVLIRPSGTEAKLKAYIETTERPVVDVDQSRRRLNARLATISVAVGNLIDDR